MIYQVNKPFRSSTDSEILVKIGSLDSEKQVLECRPLKKIKIKKNMGSIYSPVDMHYHSKFHQNLSNGWGDIAFNVFQIMDVRHLDFFKLMF